ncbi:MAG: 2-oxo acid dehydrogenase subunit E2 [Tepidanaerobacteraceae bacterium]
MVVDDEITIRPMMNLTLSCDHRAIDGAVGAKFLQNLKEILEEPMNLLL